MASVAEASSEDPERADSFADAPSHATHDQHEVMVTQFELAGYHRPGRSFPSLLPPPFLRGAMLRPAALEASIFQVWFTGLMGAHPADMEVAIKLRQVAFPRRRSGFINASG